MTTEKLVAGPLRGATFAEFARINRLRCESKDGFNHALSSWSTSDWFTAILGELGEAANIAKKLNRVRDGIPGNKVSQEELQAKLRQELGDVFVYLDLIAQSLGFFIGEAATEVFNTKSEELGCSIRLLASLPSRPPPLVQAQTGCPRCGCIEHDGPCMRCGLLVSRYEVFALEMAAFEQAAAREDSIKFFLHQREIDGPTMLTVAQIAGLLNEYAAASPMQGVQACDHGNATSASIDTCRMTPECRDRNPLYCAACGSCEHEGHDKTCPDPKEFAVRKPAGQRAEGAEAGKPLTTKECFYCHNTHAMGLACTCICHTRELDHLPEAPEVKRDPACSPAPPVAEKTELGQRTCDASHVETEEGASGNRFLGRPSSVQEIVRLAHEIQEQHCAVGPEPKTYPCKVVCKCGAEIEAINRDALTLMFVNHVVMEALAVPAPSAMGSGQELRERIEQVISAGDDLRYDEYGVMEMPIGHLATKWDIAKAELEAALALPLAPKEKT